MQELSREGLSRQPKTGNSVSKLGAGKTPWLAQMRAGVEMSGSEGCRKQQHNTAKRIRFAELVSEMASNICINLA